MLNEGLRITVNEVREGALVKFSLARPRFPTRARRWGYLLGAAAVGLAVHLWKDGPGDTRSGPPASAHGALAGSAHIGDGDSVTIAGVRLRLVGIDAPELAQTCRRDGRATACGEEAKAHLETLIGGRPLDCAWDRLDRYGRGLARCRAGSTDLGAAMVRDGWALAYGDHEAEEAEARRHRRGLWAGDFEPPEDFRRRERGD
jgi:endonuclease YncB( thermonuclease family)